MRPFSPSLAPLHAAIWSTTTWRRVAPHVCLPLAPWLRLPLWSFLPSGNAKTIPALNRTLPRPPSGRFFWTAPC